MTDRIDPETQEMILQFVQKRIDLIRAGDRAGLNQTYVELDLKRRNQYNSHDYDWYLNLIEEGFGEKTQRIDIQPCKYPESLPFSGLVTVPWAPDYKVFINTVTDRRTLWMIRMFEDGLKVVLPAFSGKTADQVATGVWQLPLPGEQSEDATTILEFHPEKFTADVVESLTLSLPVWQRLLQFEKIRALVLDCFPWYGQCWIAFLTNHEDFPEEETGKWDIGDWRWGEAAEISVDLLELLSKYYEGKTVTDTDLTLQERADVIYRCLAKALQHPQITEIIQRFDLADDFEIAVFVPDHFDRGNFCVQQ